uniref:NADH-ubiquinone oxidoreductase chain 4L n=1 Tax=Gomphocerus licenti TaxID=647970 RepID=D3ITU3_9ORTH|nr:NADH dehydrogenase subunit 4L [Gomphocerus licenti]ACR48319.1 NADH dehydrogenase subunit 4L [Gomphocerus licenti]
MYMFSIFTSLLLYFSGVYVFSSKRKHLLMVLLSLEYIVLSLFMLIIVFLIEFDYDYLFPVIFLVFSVWEGALGPSILVSMIRSHGNDYFFNSFVLSLC